MTSSGLTNLWCQLVRIDFRYLFFCGRLLLNEVNHRDFQLKAMQHVDAGQTSRADAIDFDQLAADDVNADKVQTIIDQTITD